MTVTDKSWVEAFLAFVDALRERGATRIKCEGIEVDLMPSYSEDSGLPELEVDAPEDDEELLFYSAR